MQIRDDNGERNTNGGGLEPAADRLAADSIDDSPALLARVGRGDREAFETLYERFEVLVYSTAVHVLGDAAAAEDVTQEVFLRLWRRPDRYDADRGRFISWLLSITRNRAIDELRGRGRRRRFETDPPEAAENSIDHSAEGDPSHLALLQEDRIVVRKALLGLPAEQRTAIEMAYFGEMTQVEIAEALSQPLGTIKTRIRLGMQKMRAAMLANERTPAG